MANKLHISDHALVRYLERHYGLKRELDMVREELRESIHTGWEVCGDGSYPCEGGRVVVRNCIAVTFLTRDK